MGRIILYHTKVSSISIKSFFFLHWWCLRLFIFFILFPLFWFWYCCSTFWRAFHSHRKSHHKRMDIQWFSLFNIVSARAMETNCDDIHAIMLFDVGALVFSTLFYSWNAIDNNGGLIVHINQGDIIPIVMLSVYACVTCISLAYHSRWLHHLFRSYTSYFFVFLFFWIRADLVRSILFTSIVWWNN